MSAEKQKCGGWSRKKYHNFGIHPTPEAEKMLLASLGIGDRLKKNERSPGITVFHLSCVA